ncbi:hypothetical protein [Robertkochia aurantiaca]|uniref:hypothetical protein n=1 Tax=Robertkochia aurantiaca TaxID=2873700 RepID=UPI001CCEBD92|nr:hypothetical protein [Robertkochia sp. 3YJGBD-33]
MKWLKNICFLVFIALPVWLNAQEYPVISPQTELPELFPEMLVPYEVYLIDSRDTPKDKLNQLKFFYIPFSDDLNEKNRFRFRKETRTKDSVYSNNQRSI